MSLDKTIRRVKTLYIKSHNNSSNNNNHHHNEYKKNIIITIIFTFIYKQLMFISFVENNVSLHTFSRDTCIRKILTLLFSCTHSCKIICNYEF